MNSDLTMTNESFSFLVKSSDFLNVVLNNITSCVLLLDIDIRLRAFNNPLKTIFSNKKNEDLLYKRCGEAYQVEFSTRLFRFNREKYIILIIEDISRYYQNGRI